MVGGTRQYIGVTIILVNVPCNKIHKNPATCSITIRLEAEAYQECAASTSILRPFWTQGQDFYYETIQVKMYLPGILDEMLGLDSVLEPH